MPSICRQFSGRRFDSQNPISILFWTICEVRREPNPRSQPAGRSRWEMSGRRMWSRLIRAKVAHHCHVDQRAVDPANGLPMTDAPLVPGKANISKSRLSCSPRAAETINQATPRQTLRAWLNTSCRGIWIVREQADGSDNHPGGGRRFCSIY